MSQSDEELIAGVAAGDREAFAALYRQRRPDVFRFALHMTGSPSAAEDVAQEVFLAVIREAARYTPGRSGLVPWLLGIARNHALRRITERRHDPLPEPGHEPGIDADPADGIARGQDIAALRETLRTLPVVFREAVVLCDLQELSYQDAADAAGCAVGTIRSRLHRGRALLAAALRKGIWTETTRRSNSLSRTRFAR
jgi:RNA polymerase sigma-70 factor (ECF subfamily)